MVAVLYEVSSDVSCQICRTSHTEGLFTGRTTAVRL